MNDRFDREIRDSLHDTARGMRPDLARARSTLPGALHRRLRRSRALTAGVSAFAILGLTAVVLGNAARNGGVAEISVANGERAITTSSSILGPESFGSTPMTVPEPGSTDGTAGASGKSHTSLAGGSSQVGEPKVVGPPVTQNTVPPPLPTGSGHSDPRTAPPPLPTGNGDLVFTEADSGRTVEVTKGATIEIHLSATSGVWTAPSSDNSGVIAAGSSTAAPNGAATATFTVVGKGQAQVTASSEPACAKSVPACLAPSRQFTLGIVVA